MKLNAEQVEAASHAFWHFASVLCYASFLLGRGPLVAESAQAPDLDVYVRTGAETIGASILTCAKHLLPRAASPLSAFRSVMI